MQARSIHRDFPKLARNANSVPSFESQMGAVRRPVGIRDSRGRLHGDQLVGFAPVGVRQEQVAHIAIDQPFAVGRP